MSRTSRIESENKRLSMEVEEMKEACSRTSTLNVKFKLQLEEDKNLKSDLIEGNAKLKKKVNDLSVQCYQQNEKIRMLESNLRRSVNASSRASRVPVRIIGNISDIMQDVDPTQTKPYLDLQKKYDELENQHQEALEIIDELEFELGDVMSIKRHNLMSTSFHLFFLFLSISFISFFFTYILYRVSDSQLATTKKTLHSIFNSVVSFWRAKTTTTGQLTALAGFRLITSKWKFFAYNRRMHN